MFFLAALFAIANSLGAFRWNLDFAG